VKTPRQDRPSTKSSAPKKLAPKASAKKASAKRSGTDKLALASALVANAKAAHEAKVERLRAKALAAIARIREAQGDIAGNMVDIGLALVELKEKGVAEALGRKGFAEVCEKDLSLPLATANGLVKLATCVPRTVVAKLGPSKASAVLDLVEATPEDDTVEELMAAKLRLPSGRVLDVSRASVAEIREAAKEVRAAHSKPEAPTRGFTTSPAEKKRFGGFAKALAESGHGAAKLVAARDGRGAKVRFEVRLADLEAFLASARKLLPAR
jgi:uncharacterized protein YaiL (DUF2058 family)